MMLNLLSRANLIIREGITKAAAAWSWTGRAEASRVHRMGLKIEAKSQGL
jgi:hypothetical protein